MKKIILLLIGSLFYIISVWGQQLSSYNLYRNNWMLLNPASFSQNYLLNSSTQSVGVTGRYQWQGLEESPTTTGLQYQQVIEALNVGLGATIINDQTGAIGSTSAHGTFSYIMPIQKKRSRVTQFLSIGFNVGVLQYKVNFSQITFNEPSTSIPSDNQRQYELDAGLGLFYYVDNKFYMGLSIPQLLPLKTQIRQSTIDFFQQQEPHFYSIIGTYLPIGKFLLEPSVWIRYLPNTPLSMDGMIRLNYQNNLWIGAGYSLSKNINAELGYIFKNNVTNANYLTMGLAYAFNTNSYGVSLGSTFELNISYAWGKSNRLLCPFE